MPTGGSLMKEQIRASAVWRQALVIVLRHPVATVVPALFLGALTEAPHLLPNHRSVLELLSAFLTESLAFYLYVASFATALTYGRLRLSGRTPHRVRCPRCAPQRN